MKSLFIGIVVLLLVGLYAASTRYFASNDIQACTEEAKLCPDGSYVGRTGPSCAFAACPIKNTDTNPPVGSGQPPNQVPVDNDEEEIVFCTADVKQCPDGSYVGRTGPSCAFAACPLTKKEEIVFCTADAKQCPDGSYVGRTGPSCAFAPCP